MLPRLRGLIRTLFRQSSLDRDLDEELRGYIEMVAEKKIAAGVDPSIARRDAMHETGSVTLVKENVRAGRIGAALEMAMGDARYALRGLVRAPGFAVAAIVTLALGIGANTAIFSVVRAMLLTPLPYRDSSRLVCVWSDMSAIGYPRAPLSAP